MESGIATLILRARSVARARGLAVADVALGRFAAVGEVCPAGVRAEGEGPRRFLAPLHVSESPRLVCKEVRRAALGAHCERTPQRRGT